MAATEVALRVVVIHPNVFEHLPSHGLYLRARVSRTKCPEHGRDPDNVVGVVCDMLQAFLSGVAENFPNAEVTVDWFHIVQQAFTKALDDVRKKERREKGHPKALRWAVLKNPDDGNLTGK